MNKARAEVAVRKNDKVMFHVLGFKNGLVQLIGQDGNKTEANIENFNYYTYVDRKRVYVELFK